MNLHIFGQMTLTREPGLLNGEGKVSSTNGAGCPHANEAGPLHNAQTLTQNGLYTSTELKL